MSFFVFGGKSHQSSYFINNQKKRVQTTQTQNSRLKEPTKKSKQTKPKIEFY